MTEMVVKVHLQRATECRGNAFRKEIRRYFDNDRRIETYDLKTYAEGSEKTLYTPSQGAVPFQHSHDYLTPKKMPRRRTLNTSGRLRVAISLRANTMRPRVLDVMFIGRRQGQAFTVGRQVG